MPFLKRQKTSTVTPTEKAPPIAVTDNDPPPEIFAGLTAAECKAIIAYVEAGTYAEARRLIQQWDARANQAPTRGATPASQFFAKPHIRAAVSRLQTWWAEHTSVQASRVLDALEAQAFADPALIYEQDGESWELKPLSQWPLHMRQSVHKIHYTETTSGYGKLKRTTRRVNVDFANRQSALEMLGRHLRLFDANKEQTVPFTLVVNTAPAEPEGPKPVGPQVIDGIGLQIHLPEE